MQVKNWLQICLNILAQQITHTYDNYKHEGMLGNVIPYIKKSMTLEQ